MFNNINRRKQAIRLSPAQLERKRQAINGIEPRWVEIARTALYLGMGVGGAVIGYVLLIIVMGSPELFGAK